MRRTGRCLRHSLRSARIISAHAENRARRYRLPSSYSDHLRACGEQWIAHAPGPNARGSSPRMRRTADPVVSRTDANGIISAHAENSLSAASSRSGRGDHLRACGEQGSRAQITGAVDGSSPRMRRTVTHRHTPLCRRGIISAHAENSQYLAQSSPTSRDHLRACGEQFSIRGRNMGSTGSSPRMRRTGTSFEFENRLPRIISAHAENSGR